MEYRLLLDEFDDYAIHEIIVFEAFPQPLGYVTIYVLKRWAICKITIAQRFECDVRILNMSWFHGRGICYAILCVQEWWVHSHEVYPVARHYVHR